MTLLADLPPELLELIAQHLQTHNLKLFSLIAKRFHVAAAPLLFKKFRTDLTYSKIGSPELHPLHRKLATLSLQIFGYVKDLEITIKLGAASYLNAKVFGEQLGRLLGVTANLATVKLRIRCPARYYAPLPFQQATNVSPGALEGWEEWWRVAAQLWEVIPPDAVEKALWITIPVGYLEDQVFNLAWSRFLAKHLPRMKNGLNSLRFERDMLNHDDLLEDDVRTTVQNALSDLLHDCDSIREVHLGEFWRGLSITDNSGIWHVQDLVCRGMEAQAGEEAFWAIVGKVSTGLRSLEGSWFRDHTSFREFLNFPTLLSLNIVCEDEYLQTLLERLLAPNLQHLRIDLFSVPNWFPKELGKRFKNLRHLDIVESVIDPGCLVVLAETCYKLGCRLALILSGKKANLSNLESIRTYAPYCTTLDTRINPEEFDISKAPWASLNDGAFIDFSSLTKCILGFYASWIPNHDILSNAECMVIYHEYWQFIINLMRHGLFTSLDSLHITFPVADNGPLLDVRALLEYRPRRLPNLQRLTLCLRDKDVVDGSSAVDADDDFTKKTLSVLMLETCAKQGISLSMEWKDWEIYKEMLDR